MNFVSWGQLASHVTHRECVHGLKPSLGQSVPQLFKDLEQILLPHLLSAVVWRFVIRYWRYINTDNDNNVTTRWQYVCRILVPPVFRHSYSDSFCGRIHQPRGKFRVPRSGKVHFPRLNIYSTWCSSCNGCSSAEKLQFLFGLFRFFGLSPR